MNQLAHSTGRAEVCPMQFEFVISAYPDKKNKNKRHINPNKHSSFVWNLGRDDGVLDGISHDAGWRVTKS